MFGFDKMFDFNRDEKLDSFDHAMQFQHLDELEFMKPDERREVLKECRT